MAFHLELRTTTDLELDQDDPLRQRIERLYGAAVVKGSQREESSYDFLYSDFHKGFLEGMLGEALCGEALGLFCEFPAEDFEPDYLYPVSSLVQRLRERMPEVYAVISQNIDGLALVYAKAEVCKWDMEHCFVATVLDLCIRPAPGQPILCIRW